MEPLPPPPSIPLSPSFFAERRAPRPGELTTGWRTVFGIGWVGVILGFAAVWKSARTLGLGPWWLGPASAPQLIAVELVPFVLPVAMLVGALRNIRHLPVFGIIAAVVLILIAVPDLGEFSRLALAESTIATAGLLVSIAAFAGQLRAVGPDA